MLTIKLIQNVRILAELLPSFVDVTSSFFLYSVVLLWSPGWAAGGGLVRVHEDGAGVAGPVAAAPGHLFLALKPVGPSSAAHRRANGPTFAKFRLFFFFLFSFSLPKSKRKFTQSWRSGGSRPRATADPEAPVLAQKTAAPAIPPPRLEKKCTLQ